MQPKGAAGTGKSTGNRLGTDWELHSSVLRDREGASPAGGPHGRPSQGRGTLVGYLRGGGTRRIRYVRKYSSPDSFAGGMAQRLTEDCRCRIISVTYQPVQPTVSQVPVQAEGQRGELGCPIILRVIRVTIVCRECTGTYLMKIRGRSQQDGGPAAMAARFILHALLSLPYCGTDVQTYNTVYCAAMFGGHGI